MKKSFSPEEKVVAAILLETYWEHIREEAARRMVPPEELSTLDIRVRKSLAKTVKDKLPPDWQMVWELMPGEKRDAAFGEVIGIHRAISEHSRLRALSFDTVLDLAHAFCYALGEDFRP